MTDDSKKAAAPPRTIIRRAAKVVGTQTKPTERPKTVSASANPATAPAPTPRVEQPVSEVRAEASPSEPAANPTAAATPAAAPSRPRTEIDMQNEKASPFRARVISRPQIIPVDGKRQDLTEDGIAQDLTQSMLKKTGDAKPGVPVLTDDAAKGKGKRRQEISRKALQEENDAFGRMNRLGKKKRKRDQGPEVKAPEVTAAVKPPKRTLKMGEHISVGDLAKRMSIKAGDVIKRLLEMGMMVTVNQNIDFDTAAIISSEFGFEIQQTTTEEESILETVADKPEELVLRPPIVTVMGHVDHGKTTLLDSIRKADVASGEKGGITQHIGAYKVTLAGGRAVTFLDTPGHEAFTAMRARGAEVTDIIILVVAADDGIMPQTIEAINHAKAAKSPIIVAINKVDKPGADIERVKKALTEYELVPEEWGGSTIMAPVSAKTQAGLPQFLENLALQAEIMELKANPHKKAKGAVVEARLERGRGPVATLIVREGTLRAGEVVVVGQFMGRIRAMHDHKGAEIKEATPSTPVEILGLNGVPVAGDTFLVVNDEKEAKVLSTNRARRIREKELVQNSMVSIDQIYQKIGEGKVTEIKVIIKSDVQGSAEALSKALQELSTPQIRLSVLHSAAGAITESDVNLAKASGSLLIGFNIRPEPKAKALAEVSGVNIALYGIIYEAIDEVKKIMEGRLKPTLQEEVVGRAEVREVFKISKIGIIAGCLVTEGKIQRSSKIRVVRDSVPIYEGNISNLKRFKDDAREVASGLECGLSMENYNDIKQGDVLEAFVVHEIAQKL